jgi:hypothetical protein
VVTMTLPSSSMVATRNGEHYSGPFAGMRNRIINGDVRIDQRYNHVAQSIVNGYFADRWVVGQAPATVYYCSCPTTAGFPGFSYAACAAAAGVYVPNAGDALNMGQRIEGINIVDLQWGTANAKPVTLSFWAWATVAGTYSGAILNGANNRSYPFTYNIPVANTATYCVVTIPGDVTGTWATDNTTGIYVAWDLGSGANYRSAAGVWAAGTYVGVTGTVQLSTPAAGTIYITGAQLEAGSIATPFERRATSVELLMCRRYYYASWYASSIAFVISGYGGSAGANISVPFSLPTTMRAAPSAAFGSWNFTNVSTFSNYAAPDLITFILVPAATGWVSGSPASGGGFYLNAEL